MVFKMKGTRFWEKINDTKILYLALHLVQLHLHVLNIGFSYHLSFHKTLFPSFLLISSIFSLSFFIDY